MSTEQRYAEIVLIGNTDQPNAPVPHDVQYAIKKDTERNTNRLRKEEQTPYGLMNLRSGYKVLTVVSVCVVFWIMMLSTYDSIC